MTGAARMTGTVSGALYQGARPGRAESGPSSALALLHQFPPRPMPDSWPAAVQPRQLVTTRLLTDPYTSASAALQAQRRRGLARVLDWLEHQPGDSWQDRWLASGADAEGNIAWRRLAVTSSANRYPRPTSSRWA